MDPKTEHKIKESLNKQPEHMVEYALFNYGISNLSQTNKVKFFYALKGRNRQGMLQRTDSKQLAKSVILTPIKNDTELQDFLRAWNISFERRIIFMETEEA